MARWLALVLVAAIVAAMGLAATRTVRYLNRDAGVLMVTGLVEAKQVEVSARITGRVVQLTVREGQPVEQGQLLAALDGRELNADVRRAEAALAAAQAELHNLVAGTRPEEIREAEARAARAEAQLQDLLAGSRLPEIEQARAALRNATVSREFTERELRRGRDLYRKELIAAQEVDRAKQAYDSAAASEAAARERLALLEAGPREHEVVAARAELRAARERVALLRAGPRVHELEAARARMTEANAGLTLARARLDETSLRSPLTGLVLRKNMEEGETVNPGAPILVLLDPTAVWVRAYVPEADIGRVKVGQAAAITVDAFPYRAFAGTVTEVASEAEFTPKNVQTRKERVNLVFRVKISARNPDGVLKPGMPADAEIRP